MTGNMKEFDELPVHFLEQVLTASPAGYRPRNPEASGNIS